jgi:hypothetical protein
MLSLLLLRLNRLFNFTHTHASQRGITTHNIVGGWYQTRTVYWLELTFTTSQAVSPHPILTLTIVDLGILKPNNNQRAVSVAPHLDKENYPTQRMRYIDFAPRTQAHIMMTQLKIPYSRHLNKGTYCSNLIRKTTIICQIHTCILQVHYIHTTVC